MPLIIGLGNPGEKYTHTRHNAGFMMVDEFVNRNEFPDFQPDKKSQSLLTDGSIRQTRVFVAKPQTLMNNSGRAVKILAQRYGIRDIVIGRPEKTQIHGRHFRSRRNLLISPENFLQKSRTLLGSLYTGRKSSQASYVLLVHDDIDLPLGSFRISVGSGAGGHKGVASVIQHLRTKDFARIRIGIQPTRGKPSEVDTFVLKNFTPEERIVIKDTIHKTIDALDVIFADGIQKAMDQFN